jgi:glycosyltransferase involved in cell wall biosynthesis
VLARGFDVVNFHNISLIGGPALLRIPAKQALKIYTLHEHWLVCSTHVFWKNGNMRCDSRSCLRCVLRSGIPPQAWRLGAFVRHCLEHVATLIAPSRFTAAMHRQNGIVCPIEIVPLFTRLPADRGESNTTPGARFLYVGRLAASKGIGELLTHIAATPHSIDVAGDGELLASLQKQYATNERVRFLGRLNEQELAQAYRAATAVIVPSIAPETFGLAVVEAMAFGTPAIVRDSGGCAEIVNDTGAGLIYSTPDELRLHLDAIARDPQLRRRLSVRARAEFSPRFTPERYLRDYLGLIERLRAAQPAGAVA